MCGIVGLWNVATKRPLANVGAMLDAMKHRGPDGRGTLEYAGGAAGMVRLALVDLSARGMQPIWSEDRRVAILFNGEIYNFRSERDRLEKAAHRFRTTTDTEVVLHLYLEHGLDFHRHLRGMYALAIFDWRRTRPGGTPELLLARGPLGVKPLYVAHPHGDPGRVIFSSELRGMLASGHVAPTINREALADYLAHGFVLQPGTLISGVRMLEPGTLERYTPGEPVFRKLFWRMPPYARRAESLDESAERLRTVLDESVALHAMADAPIGAFLSGGIDSTGIVGLMRRHVADLRTYTITFPDLPGDDEVHEAAAAARAFDCRHTVVEITSPEVAEIMPCFAGELDQPSADGLNTWLISRAASRDVKGVLSGLGGDEWFAGYPVTRRMARYARTSAGRFQAAAGAAAYHVAPWIPFGRVRSRVQNLASRRHALATWVQSHTVFHQTMAGRIAGLAPGGMTQEDKLAALLVRDRDDWRRETPVGVSCLLDTRVYMAHQLLRDSDATSMAHSLELRVPYVDLELAAFSRSCADEFKLRPDGGSSDQYALSGSKRVLIHALRDLLPSSIVNRPKKGFSLPYDLWMQKDLAPLVEDTSSDASIRRRGLVDPAAVAELRGQAQAGRPGVLYPKLWTLMILELWCRAVLDIDRKIVVESLAVGV
ncbi:MAG: asparagine synthase (glutamine-hydrolyzing) [Pirellulales bacterium]